MRTSLAIVSILSAVACHGAVAAVDYQRLAMERDGDSVRGKALFEDEQRLACSRCHSVDGKGGKAGPDLFAAGDQFPRRGLIEAVVHPSAAIAVGYGTTIVQTKSEEDYAGVLKESSADWVELACGDGTRRRLKASEISAQRNSPVSLMPEGLHAALTAQEFCDLIEYLVSLKETGAASHRGMPSEIPRAPLDVALRPLFKAPLRMPPSENHSRWKTQTGLVAIAQLPGCKDTLLAADQAGIIWRIHNGAVSTFANFTREVYSASGPNGLLGFAFHPRFAENRKYYLKLQAFDEGKIATVIIERRATDDLTIDSGERPRTLLRIDAVAEHHNGGCIQFGPDGFLYIGMGDSAPNHDPQGHGQDLRLLLGKMLRIDVDHRAPGAEYAIPPDNPFVGRGDARAEIWASGFREPWRFSFDRATGDLWVADLGQERGDEVAIVRRGENHGWNVYEGFGRFSDNHRKAGAEYVAPIFAARRKQGAAIVGGHVYRGNSSSPLYGAFIFGDHVSKRVWSLRQENRALSEIHELAVAPDAITAFEVDSSGRIYVACYQGMIYELAVLTPK